MASDLNPDAAAAALFRQALRAQRDGRTAAAERLYRQMLAAGQGPEPAILSNLAAIAVAREDWAEAEALARKALAIAPDFADAGNNLGLALMGQGLAEQALEAFQACLAAAPGHGGGVANLADAFNALGREAEALKTLEQAILAAPKRHLDKLDAVVLAKLDRADWDGLGPLLALLRKALAAGAPIDPYLALLVCQDPREIQQAGRNAAAVARREAQALPPWSPPPPNAGRYRIGYFSSTLKAHAIGFLVRELVAAHDRDRFEVVAYPYRPAPDDAFTTALRASFERVVDLSSMTDAEALERLRADRLDVLLWVDGYADGPRAAIIEARAAPVQANWLGFPGTTGSKAVDYIVADASVLPPSVAACSDETPVLLPNGYFPSDGARQVSDRFAGRQDLGWPEGPTLIGAFNQARKINPFIIGLWAEILRRTEDACLVLWETDAMAMANIRAALTARGAPGDRVLTTPSMRQPDHLCRYRFLDMFVDTYPYNGHTMTNDALFMGVPGVALRGRTFASRVAASLLERAGLPDLVAETPADYVRLATELVRDPQRRAEARSRIAAAAAARGTFSGARYGRDFETALAAMAERARAGLPPAPLNL